MKVLTTTLGPVEREGIRVILPHEHVVVDLRRPSESSGPVVPASEITRLMAPQLRAAARSGVDVLVDCATGGIGRRPDALIAASQASGVPIVMATGVYREPWVPDWVVASTEERLEAWMHAELTVEVERTGVRAGWIKLSAGDGGMSAVEQKILRAAARAASRTGSVIGSHTISGRVALEQLDALEAEGADPHRFIWIHAQEEPDLALHYAAASRGAWIEYDHVGRAPDRDLVAMIERVFAQGFGDRLLISQDRGWYDPAMAGGGRPLPYTHLTDSLLPALTAAGFSDEVVRCLTRDNPFDAFAR